MYMTTPRRNLKTRLLRNSKNSDMPGEVHGKSLNAGGRTRYRRLPYLCLTTKQGRRTSWQRSYAYFMMIRLMDIRNPIHGTIFPKSIAIRTGRHFQRQNRSISTPARYSAAYLASWACENTSNPTAIL